MLSDRIRSFDKMEVSKVEKIILGIGNPGYQYEMTRHNIGFRIIDHLVASLKISFESSLWNGLAAKASIENQECIFIKPMTYVNSSGQCAKAVLSQCTIPYSSLLIIVDDLALPVGKIRLRQKGSSGGHRGLDSIIQSLGTIEFPRLRIGIGNCICPEKASYVLAPFSLEEEDILSKVIPKAGEVVLSWTQEADIKKVMNQTNRINITNHE